MTIKNNNGREREVKLLFEVEKDNSKYMIYEDLTTENIYAGKIIKNELLSLNEEEYEYLNKIIEKFKEVENV